MKTPHVKCPAYFQHFGDTSVCFQQFAGKLMKSSWVNEREGKQKNKHILLAFRIQDQTLQRKKKTKFVFNQGKNEVSD